MDQELNVIQQKEDLDHSKIAAYWTEERMANAIPIEIPKNFELPKPIHWEQDGPLTIMESVGPERHFPLHPDGSDQKIAANTYTTTLVPTSNYTTAPWQNVGKLYMVFGGKNYVGSAWVIAGSNSGIFTAGHCVYDNGTGGGNGAGWASSVMFKPRYNNGNSLGTWYMSTLFTLQGWADKSGYQYDLGCCLATSQIAPTTGGLGWIANGAPNLGPYTAIGYPATPVSGYNFNGQAMWQSVGNYINGSSIIQMYNNMTGGCSGGPWSVTMNGVVYANGVNSHRFTNNPSTMYSPYFGTGFLNLYNEIKGK